MRSRAALAGLVTLAACGPDTLKVSFIDGATREAVVLAERFSPRAVQQPGGRVRLTYRAAGANNRQLEFALTVPEADGGVGTYGCGGDSNALMVYRDELGRVFRSAGVCSIAIDRPIALYQDSREFKLQFSGRLQAGPSEEFVLEEGRAQGTETASTPRIPEAEVLIE